MSERTISIHGSPGNPRIVEIDGEQIVRIIMRVSHVREKLAIRTASEIMDYLTETFKNNSAAQ